MNVMAEITPVIEAQPASIPRQSITLGVTDTKAEFAISLPKLLDGRLLIQGQSGAGKSWLLRRLLEQSSGLIQHIVIDPEGEFRSFAASADYLVVDAARLDGNGFASLGRRVREQRLSIVLDVSQIDRERQMIAVAGLLRALVECPREHWHPTLVAIDEAHLFAPLGGQGVESNATRRVVISSVVDLMSRGRKRGLASVLATQRLARLSKSVASEASNFLIGHNTLDLDIRRAAEIIGWDARRAFDRMPKLRSGQFIASGAAFNLAPVTATIGSVRSAHSGQTPILSAPPLPTAEEAEALLGIEDLSDEAEDAPPTLPASFRAVRGLIANPASPLATRIFADLSPLYPDGAELQQLQAHLAANEQDFGAAIDLLMTWNAVTMSGSVIRIERSMADRAKC